MNCIRCKRDIPNDSLFCSYCGKKQNTADSAAPHKRRRKKGSGSVYKLSGKRSKPWIAYNKGVIGSFATSAQAVNALDSFNASEKTKDKFNYTFEDVYKVWKPSHFKKISESARASYTSAYAKASHIKNMRMRDIKTEELQSVIDSIVNEGLSRSLCEKQRQLFSQLCKCAMTNDIIDKNYAEFLNLPQQPQAKVRILTDEEIEKISNCTDDKRIGETAKITLALIYTGMRINELLSLRTENVHLDGGYVIGGEKTEAGKNRIIPIHNTVMTIFKVWYSSTKCEWLIPSKQNNKRDARNVRESFYSLMKRLDITDVSPHTCRHTAASLMARWGVKPAVAKAILGHADITTTMNIYTHVQPEELIKSINLIQLAPQNFKQSS